MIPTSVSALVVLEPVAAPFNKATTNIVELMIATVVHDVKCIIFFHRFTAVLTWRMCTICMDADHCRSAVMLRAQ